MDDRQFIGINGTFSLFWYEVVHHAEEASGQEEAHSVVAIPPLCHRVLDARHHLNRTRTEDRHWNNEVVYDVKHRDGDDEGQEEPVRNVDVRLFTFDDRSEEDQQVCDPNDSQPKVNVPFRLCVFFRLGCAHQVACCGQNDEQVVTPEHEPREVAAPKTSSRSALNDVERCRDQRITTKCENNCRGVQRTQATEVAEAL